MPGLPFGFGAFCRAALRRVCHPVDLAAGPKDEGRGAEYRRFSGSAFYTAAERYRTYDSVHVDLTTKYTGMALEHTEDFHRAARVGIAGLGVDGHVPELEAGVRERPREQLPDQRRALLLRGHTGPSVPGARPLRRVLEIPVADLMDTRTVLIDRVKIGASAVLRLKST